MGKCENRIIFIYKKKKEEKSVYTTNYNIPI